MAYCVVADDYINTATEDYYRDAKEMNKTFILAFNYDEAKNFIRKRNEGNPLELTEYIILNRREQLLGTVNPVVKVLPNAYRREDYNDFIDMIRMRNGIRY